MKQGKPTKMWCRYWLAADGVTHTYDFDTLGRKRSISKGLWADAVAHMTDAKRIVKEALFEQVTVTIQTI